MARHEARRGQKAMAMIRIILPALIAAAATLFAAGDALACACCTNRGQRNVGAQEFDDSKRAVLDEIVFQSDAQLYVGEGDLEFIEGIDQPDSGYALQVDRDAASLTFAFKGQAGQTGSLKLILPRRVSVFEVDPRDTPDSGLGPGLYKEWKLTGEVQGAGSFAAASAAGHKLTLILHGDGNSCTSSIDFGHWTLVMEGPQANYTLIGDLKREP